MYLVPVSSILFSLSMVSHSPSYTIQPSFFQSSFLGVPSGVYSRIRGNIFPTTLCVQIIVNSFYPVASNIFFPIFIVALMASILDFDKASL